MDQAVEHGVVVSGVANQRAPLIDGELAGDDGGAATITVLEDLQEVVTSRGVERLEAPVVEDEQIDAAERTACQSEIGEQPRDPLIEHGAVVAAGLVTERRGEPALADAGGPADQQVGMLVDPSAFDQHRQEAEVEATRGAIVDVLDTGLLAQLGVCSRFDSRLSTSQRSFAFEREREPFGAASTARGISSEVAPQNSPAWRAGDQPSA
jgi:hypothetical protein